MADFNFLVSNAEIAEIESSELEKYITQAILVGSRTKLLSWSDFQFYVNSETNVEDIKDIKSAYKAGCPFIDCIYYFNCPNKPDNINFRVRRKSDDVEVKEMETIRGLFCWYFSLYSQGRALADGPNNFISKIMAFGDNYKDYVEKLSSADMEKMPSKWIKNIKMNDLSEASRNRLSLGAAGHRFLQSLTYLTENDFKEGKEENVKYVRKLRNWTKDQVYWDLHPLYKSGAVITVTKSLNKAIMDCLADGLKPEVVKKLVDSKVLFDNPMPQPAHTYWRTSDTIQFPVLQNPVFN